MYSITVGGNMFTYNIEYRKNILFIRLIGNLNINNIEIINDELNLLIKQLGFINIVFNLEELEYIDIYSINNIISWYNLIKKRKGVSFICGVHGYDSRCNLLNYMNEIGNEISAIKVINWNN